LLFPELAVSSVPVSAPLRWWRPLQRSDRRALGAIVGVAALLFTVPALLGHPAIVADDLIQNFPLRVLSGRQIATGHMPLLNLYANSGTPLLGGLNAGALYPMTVIFAFITPIAAWVLNLIVVYVTAGVGMFALLRWHGLHTLSSFAAAMSFSYTGAMIAQVVHLGVVQGFALVPWAVLMLLSLSRRLGRMEPTASWTRYARTVLPWTVGLALLWGLTFLTGEPRAIAEMQLVTVLAVAVILLMRTSYALTNWRARATYLASVAVGVGWGAGVAFVQLVPGWSFIGLSQRSNISYEFFGAGSHFVQWLPSMLVQDVFGGNGLWGQPHFFSSAYNFPEVSGYAGIVALVATTAFLTRLTRRGWKGVHRDYVLYVVLGGVGWLATWGSSTPFGHLFHFIPLFGSARLQSRNVILVDFAASVLLGWWLDRIQARDTREAGLEGRARWITLLPAFCVAGLCVAMLIWGPEIVRSMGIGVQTSNLARGETLTLTLHLLVALVAIACLIHWRHSARVIGWLLAVLAADIVLFLMFSSTGLIGGGVPVSPSRPSAVALLGNQGRFALVDESGAHFLQFEELGSPNMNVFTQLPSVQGYGSLISTIYGNATGTHPVAALNPCSLANGTLAQLRLAAVAVSSSELSTVEGANIPPTSRCLAPEVTPATQRYFGQLLKVRTVTVSGYRDRSVANGPVDMQLLDSHGHATGPVEVMAGATKMTFDFRGARQPAAGFILSGPSGVEVGDASVISTGVTPSVYELNTPFQLALSSGSWRLATTAGTLAIFKATRIPGPDWLEGPTAGSRITTVKSVLWGDSWVSVKDTEPVTLVRSMSYLPGWRATARNSKTGAIISLSVMRSGLVQKVTVPAGDWTVHFHYHAPYIELGLIVSIASTLLLGAGAGTLAWRVRRGRSDKVRS
jgi:hypothetical protein